MVLHDPLSDTGLLGRHAWPHRRDYAAGLMACDQRATDGAQPQCGGGIGRPVKLEIAAAHARGLDFKDDLARPRRGVRKVHQFNLPVAFENHAFHGVSPLVCELPYRLRAFSVRG